MGLCRWGVRVAGESCLTGADACEFGHHGIQFVPVLPGSPQGDLHQNAGRIPRLFEGGLFSRLLGCPVQRHKSDFVFELEYCNTHDPAMSI